MEKTRGKSKDFGSFAVLSGYTISLCSALVIGLLELSCSRSKSPDKLLTLNDSAQLARDTIAADHVFYLTRGIGFEGRETPQFRCSDVLGRNCNTKQLEWLARNDSSYIVRLCAYRQLRRRSGQHAVAIFREFFRDTTSVKSQSGCCGSTSPYGEALQSINTFDRNISPLTIKQQNTIDSLLFLKTQMQNRSPILTFSKTCNRYHSTTLSSDARCAKATMHRLFCWLNISRMLTFHLSMLRCKSAIKTVIKMRRCACKPSTAGRM